MALSRLHECARSSVCNKVGDAEDRDLKTLVRGRTLFVKPSRQTERIKKMRAAGSSFLVKLTFVVKRGASSCKQELIITLMKVL